MLTTPTVITIDGTAHNLSRINQDNFSSVYFKKTATYELRLTVRHTYEGKAGPAQVERHNVDLVHTTWDAEGNPIIRQSYHVIRNPRNLDPDSVADDTVGLNAWLTTNIAAICAWDN
jgi:hypothetical protein